jgi:hypothetical protein
LLHSFHLITHNRQDRALAQSIDAHVFGRRLQG